MIALLFCCGAATVCHVLAPPFKSLKSEQKQEDFERISVVHLVSCTILIVLTSTTLRIGISVSKDYVGHRNIYA